jgi:chromatin segregation and condensation protein Rec8/ScpA/Scc1 (kleisin family)
LHCGIVGVWGSEFGVLLGRWKGGSVGGEKERNDCRTRRPQTYSDSPAGHFGLTQSPAQAQLSLHHPNEALSSALTAYEQVRDPAPTTKTSPKDLETFSSFVLKCKKAKFSLRDRDRERRQGGLRAEFEDTLERNKQQDLDEVSRELQMGTMGQVEAYERNQEILAHFESKVGELRSVFALADPANHKPREIPDHLVDMVNRIFFPRNPDSNAKDTAIDHLRAHARPSNDPQRALVRTIDHLRTPQAKQDRSSDPGAFDRGGAAAELWFEGCL